MVQKLNRASAAQPVKYPVKVLQYGKGNFLRGFADWMIDIANEKTGLAGAIEIVQTNSKTNDPDFSAQEGLYHVVVNGISGGKVVNEVRLVSCVAGVINPFEDYAAYLRAGENPELKFIISNTTEAGIVFDPADAGPQVIASTFPGKLTSLLYHRYRYFHGDPSKALIILPCELIEKNGEALRDTLLQYIRHWKLESSFQNWITSHTLFCNTLVDRIVPGYPKENDRETWRKTGFEDHLMVSAEPFHLWLIEPRLPKHGKHEDLRLAFPLEQAGLNVRVVADLAPYRTRKVRILNGAHTAMVAVGYLRGLRTVREVIEDPFTGDFVRRTISDEIIPTLDLPHAELNEFASDVIERFQNPFIRHELRSIALNSVSKFQVRVLPSIIEYHKRHGKLPENLVHSLAALILFYRGQWGGEAIPLNDTPEVLSFFRDVWAVEDFSTVAGKVLSNRHFWKTDLCELDGLLSAVERHMHEISRS